MREIRVAIVGGGPRGLMALERIVAKAASCPRLVVHLIDPREPGQGAHRADQPPYLLTNTVASQVTIFPPRDLCDPASASTGPSFTEWARAAGYRRFGEVFARGDIGDDMDGVAIADDDYLPRALLGEYLTAAYDRIVAAAPAHVIVRRRRDEVADLRPLDDATFVVELESGGRLFVDYAFLATGHCDARESPQDHAFRAFALRHRARNENLDHFSSAYPTSKLDRIKPNAVVAVQGLGLTAYDVIAALTLGRGGRFVGDGLARRYLPSGGEPKILLFSRNGLPYAARGVNQKGLSGAHAPAFFTRAAVALLRRRALQRRGSPQLDFQTEALPLLKLEMAYAHRCARCGDAIDPATFIPARDEIETIDDLLAPGVAARPARFAAFKADMRRRIAIDLAEADRGNLTSPIKAAADVIRDCRDSLSAAVEYSGLTPSSHQDFCERWVPTMNRIAFGPPRRRNADLLGLIDAGRVDWAGGPGCVAGVDEERACFRIASEFAAETASVAADALIVARVPTYRPEADAGRLTANLMRRGLIRPYRNGAYHPCGLDIDEDQHPIGADGAPQKAIWAIGYPAEGPRFYTHALPRPQRRSAQTLDADRAVSDMIASMRDRRTESFAVRSGAGDRALLSEGTE